MKRPRNEPAAIRAARQGSAIARAHGAMRDQVITDIAKDGIAQIEAHLKEAVR